MKLIVYKMLIGGELNLFKLKTAKVVHIQTEYLPLIKGSKIPNIVCYVQKKQLDGQFAVTERLVAGSDLLEYNIEDAAKFFDSSIERFEIREL